MTVHQIIDELESQVENSSGGLLGKRMVNGEALLIKIQQLRLLLPSSTNALGLTDQLEQLVKSSKMGFLGKYLINEEDFFVKVQQLRSALRVTN